MVSTAPILQTVAVAFVAATPIVELRASVPLGIVAFGLPVEAVLIASVVGNMLPAAFVYGLATLLRTHEIAQHHLVRRVLERISRRSESRFMDHYAKYGMIALPIFVAVPLPMTGAWTGAVAAYLLGIPFKYAFPLIGLGVAGAAVLVTLATTGAIQLL